jgi:hypothetical protein
MWQWHLSQLRQQLYEWSEKEAGDSINDKTVGN